MTRVILASASPRRRELLAALVPVFEVAPTDIPEPFTGDAAADALRLAREKAEAAAAAGAVAIGADTVVADDGREYAKPADAADAVVTLEALRGRTHRVLTGVAVACGGEVRSDISESAVTIASLSGEQIAAYVASGRPMDKAGAYAIQDEDVPTVERLDGCYCAVMGLPLWRLRGLLLEAGVAAAPPDATFARCATCPERPAASPRAR